MIRAIVLFLSAIVVAVAMKISLDGGNPYVYAIWSAILSASIVFLIMARPRKIKRYKVSKPEMSDTVIISLDKAEKQLIALCLFSMVTLLDSTDRREDTDTDTILHLSVKLGVHKEFNELAKDILDKLKAKRS